MVNVIFGILLIGFVYCIVETFEEIRLENEELDREIRELEKNYWHPLHSMIQ